jgi:glycine betaine/proline transport system permease protein
MAAVGLILLGWLILFFPLRGRNTLYLAQQDVTALHLRLNDFNDAVGAARNTSPIFLYFFNVIRLVIDQLVTALQALISQPAMGRPLPILGWLGVVAVVTYISWVFGNAKVALLAAAGFIFFGLQGLWQESMDTFALTLAAVFVSLVIGIPLGVWAGLSNRVNRLITPLLDFMQTMPTFVYLAPLTLLFLIGPASAVIATLIYAMPPAIRITSFAIRGVSKTTVEAADSMGSTRRQTLTKVMLPMGRRTIVLGVNQCIMAALSMVTIAALIDAPGLGNVVLKALQVLDVGAAFNAGLAIVIMAIVLDRVTTAAAARVERRDRHGQGARWSERYRRPLVIGGGVVTLLCCYLSYTYLWAAEFPSTITIGGKTIDIDLGNDIAKVTDTITNWVTTNLSGLTNGFKNVITYLLINPVQALLNDSPWWLVSVVVLALAALLGGWRVMVTTAICLVLLIGTGVWFDSMTTLAATLVATVLVMILGVIFGVWMGRSRGADRVIRPILDAGQTMPAFVYLVPFFALFSVSRFTGIAAAVVFAAPVAIKIIADGIRGVSETTVEAALSTGSNRRQMITKVQLPMAKSSLTLATNQGLIFVLSMVVVGGLVGGGALGYDVVAGFVQGELFGKGLAAGLAIVLLGIMLDRITQAAARRTGEAHH